MAKKAAPATGAATAARVRALSQLPKRRYTPWHTSTPSAPPMALSSRSSMSATPQAVINCSTSTTRLAPAGRSMLPHRGSRSQNSFTYTPRGKKRTKFPSRLLRARPWRNCAWTADVSPPRGSAPVMYCSTLRRGTRFTERVSWCCRNRIRSRSSRYSANTA